MPHFIRFMVFCRQRSLNLKKWAMSFSRSYEIRSISVSKSRERSFIKARGGGLVNVAPLPKCPLTLFSSPICCCTRLKICLYSSGMYAENQRSNVDRSVLQSIIWCTDRRLFLHAIKYFFKNLGVIVLFGESSPISNFI